MTPEARPRATPYAERLSVPWWSWPAALAGAAVVAAEIGILAPALPSWLPFALVLPLGAALMGWLSRIRVVVTADEWRVDDARLPLAVISQVVALDAAGKREILGVGAHPLAFVVQRPWIGGAVQVLLDDPADPTPYWVVSTRHPVRLAQALAAATR